MKKFYSMVCEQCGGRLEIFKEGSAQGVKCADCGWTVATTHISGVKIDEKRYEVSCSGDYKNEAHIRAVSEVTGYNFLTSRKTLQKGRSLVFTGQAMEVLRVRKILISAGLDCNVEPDFNWA
jgi:ribosomal protein S27E